MSAMKAEEVYKQHIRPLPPEDRLRILEMIGRDLVQSSEITSKHKPRSI